MRCVMLALLLLGCQTEKIKTAQTESITHDSVDAGVIITEESKGQTEESTNTTEETGRWERIVDVQTEAVPAGPRTRARPARHTRITVIHEPDTVTTQTSKIETQTTTSSVVAAVAVQEEVKQEVKQEETKRVEPAGPGWKFYAWMTLLFGLACLVGYVYIKRVRAM